MGLIVGSWMALIQSYQTLSLKLLQQEQQRVKFSKEWNASDISFVGKVVSSEPSRMSGGPRTVHDSSKPTAYFKR